MIKRRATAVWQGTGQQGQGQLTSQSQALKGLPYSFNSRFVSEDGMAGTNPEELLAASHAGCFTMATAFGLQQAGFTADNLETVAIVQMDPQEGGGFAMSKIILQIKGSAQGCSAEQFAQIAEGAKANCPISKALSAVPIELEIG